MIAIITTKELECQHPKDEMEYQAREEDTNVPESLSCGMCGKDLDPDILEPDWDAIAKEADSRNVTMETVIDDWEKGSRK